MTASAPARHSVRPAVRPRADVICSELEALDVNPLICGPHGAVAVDALAVRSRGSR